MAHIDDIQGARFEKLNLLKGKGWDPYAPAYAKTHSAAACLQAEGEKVSTAGRLISFRTHGTIAFADLKDESGKIQIFFKRDTLGDEAYEDLRLLDIGDHIGVSGYVMRTVAGEISILPSSYTLLTKSLLPMPSEWYGLKDVEVRYRKRYLDLLVNDDVRRIFDVRSKVIGAMRNYLDDHGFTEVETPILQPLYGGAYAKPFTTHHNALDSDFYLRIAVELYLKRLLVGGYERVYEIGKNFRNEGFSRAHNPEFTMLEFYWAYASPDDVMVFTEKMLSHVLNKVMGATTVSHGGESYDFTPPWPRETYRDMFLQHLSIDINIITTEDALRKVVEERQLLDEPVVGYGQMLDELYKKHVRIHLKGPMFVTEYPLEIKALAKASKNDPTKSASFQMLVNGVEMLNAYNELNDPLDQRERWIEEMKLADRGGEDYQVLDEDYIEALSYGMPPATGWGLGIDRFVSFITNQHTIKDVILFPTLRPEQKVQTAAKQPVEPAGAPLPSSGLQKSPRVDLVLTRDAALQMLRDHLTTKNLISHCLAVEAAMRALAHRLGGDPDLWGMVGLLHDADWDETRDDVHEHTQKTVAYLKAAGETNVELIEGILSHNYHHNGFRAPESLMEWALYTCDELTGFIVAVALIKPDKKLSVVDVQSVVKRFPVTAFAKPVDRKQITMCEEKLNIPPDEFIAIVLKAMQDIAQDIGL